MKAGLATFSRPQALTRSWPFVIDLAIAATGLAAFYGVITVAQNWLGAVTPSFEIRMSPSALPLYALFSMVRIAAAYLLSLAFALGYGYIAAYTPRLENLMVALLDILQSIPVLSFLPGVMLAMVALFPTRQLGVELGAILLIFTGQVWNMAFSFYSSLKSIPRELREACDIYGFSAWQRFWQLELPYSSIGLIWNSIMSVAGGWFFLMVCEMFVLGDRDFRLPGLGSYLQTAAGAGDTTAILWGLGVMVLIIVMTDLVIWRPLIAWSEKFKFEQVQSGEQPRSAIYELLQRSSALHMIHRKTSQPLAERIDTAFANWHQKASAQPAKKTSRSGQAAGIVIAVIIAGGGIGYLSFHALLLLRGIQWHEVAQLLKGASATFLRVNTALLIASAWTIPAGVAIGFNPRLAKIFQPLAQIAASIPAPALFPVLLLALIRLGGGLGIGSILLMILGTQWYILFNVIAGALALPSDLREVARLYRFRDWQKWQTVILPGIFPYLITGLITASGGAWNASIVAEYFHLHNQTLMTLGLGAEISAATDSKNFAVLLLATIIMALMVVTMNRLVWRRLYRLAETKYKLES